MPAIRTATPIKPVKTERTHEENQERAYIAASRRSDRSLEARVESARRASEIHKKRTGRSLRVREEDVMNEEMYEEEDDDLPMQYRRINALNPHLSYAFAERLNNYVNGQIGVRTALQQAIAQSNQYTQNQQALNSYMQQNGCFAGSPSTPSMHGQPQSPWQTNASQSFQSNYNPRSMSYAAPPEFANFQAPHPQSAPNSAVDSRRMSLPVHNVAVPGTQSPNSSYPHPGSSHGLVPNKTSNSPQQVPSPPQSVSTPPQHSSTHSPHQKLQSFNQGADASLGPLTTKLPNETLQLLDGAGAFNPGYFNLNPTTSTRPKYSYNPNGRAKPSPSDSSNGEKRNPFEGLNQTLSPSALDRQAATFPSMHEPMSAMSAPDNLGMFEFNAFEAYPPFDPENSRFDFANGCDPGAFSNSGFGTPNDPDAFGEFFNLQATPE